MRVLLIKDVFKLGRAGDIKRVADGYGRNYLIPQGLALKATPGALKQVDRIRESAQEERGRLNEELGFLAEKLVGLKLAFPVKAGETGKLYGSITTSMISDAIQAETGFEIDRRQIDSEPVKVLGVHQIGIRLTIDLVPEVTLLVHGENEPVESAYAVEGEEEPEPEGAFADLQAELEAEAEAELAAEEEEMDEEDLDLLLQSELDAETEPEAPVEEE